MNEKYLVQPSSNDLQTVCLPNGRLVPAYPITGTPSALLGIVKFEGILLWEDGKQPSIGNVKIRNSNLELCANSSVIEAGELYPRKLSGVEAVCVMDSIDLMLEGLKNIVYVTVE